MLALALDVLREVLSHLDAKEGVVGALGRVELLRVLHPLLDMFTVGANVA